MFSDGGLQLLELALDLVDLLSQMFGCLSDCDLIFSFGDGGLRSEIRRGR
jgi:hypothetical protein